jgi:hypothetical protein
MEDVAARHPKLGFNIKGCHNFNARFATAIESQAWLQRFGKHRLQRAEGCCLGPFPGVVWICGEQVARSMHAEKREGVITGGA